MGSLDIIREAIEQHRTVRAGVKRVGESVNDIEAVFSLQKMQSGWTLAAGDELAAKHKWLQETVSVLDSGLKKHFAFEEKMLPALFGDLLMDALKLEHNEIIKGLKEVNAVLAETVPRETDERKPPACRTQAQQTVGRLCRLIQEHAAREETVLHMMRKTLEATADRPAKA